MLEQFLYETLNAVESMGFLKQEIPDSVKLNLNPKFELRGYQPEPLRVFSIATKTAMTARLIPCITCSTWQPAAARRSSWRA
jgi:hypothetical protein